jgi:hypothetical protein
MYSHDIARAVAAEQTITLLAEAATARIVREARIGRRRPAATRAAVRHGLFRRWGAATA